MAIGPVMLNGIISRTQDFSSIKQSEDNKVIVDQQNFQNQFQKEIVDKSHQVNQGDDVEWENRKFDAKDKGGNEYSGDGGSERKKKDGKTNGKVIVKGRSSFDIKI